MAEVKFAVGDVVQLKSGGPRMTVAEVHRDGPTCRCLWHGRNGELLDSVLATTWLKPAPEKTVAVPHVVSFGKKPEPVAVGLSDQRPALKWQMELLKQLGVTATNLTEKRAYELTEELLNTVRQEKNSNLAELVAELSGNPVELKADEPFTFSPRERVSDMQLKRLLQYGISEAIATGYSHRQAAAVLAELERREPTARCLRTENGVTRVLLPFRYQGTNYMPGMFVPKEIIDFVEQRRLHGDDASGKF